MSRIGKKPIEIPTGVTVDITASEIKVAGPKGELSRSLPYQVSVKKEGNQIMVSLNEHTGARELLNIRALWGLVRALIANMIEGVTKGYSIKLEIEGVGYKAEVQGNDLVLDVGFSHTVKIPALFGVTFLVEKNIITVSGIDKEAVGQVAASVRKTKPVEPYKGKGIKYQGEYVRRKLGKRVAGATGAAAAK
ncbi:MAG: 50S ribosomal protein L6 [bacterium]|nr:50S ribosomal protein L6 [bacterium]